MDSINAAFSAIPRQNFLPDSEQPDADLDVPLPIGHGQTNSQPLTVRLMLQWLNALPGQKVLDVGSGSGWTTALLAYLVGDSGRVIAVEKLRELVVFGQENCRRLDIHNATFHKAGEVLGWPSDAPYDRILVSAAAKELPQELLDQLSPDGKMVLPVEGDILVVAKDINGRVAYEAHTGFAFVPLV